MKKTNFVCSEALANPKMALEDLTEKINGILKEYGYHDQLTAPAQVVTSTTPIGQQFYAYTTIWLPSADDKDTTAVNNQFE